MNTEDKKLLEDLFLLALSNKEADESLDDILNMLVNAGALTKSEGNVIIESLKEKKAINSNELTFIGNAMAIKAKERFQI